GVFPAGAGGAPSASRGCASGRLTLGRYRELSRSLPTGRGSESVPPRLRFVADLRVLASRAGALPRTSLAPPPGSDRSPSGDPIAAACRVDPQCRGRAVFGHSGPGPHRASPPGGAVCGNLDLRERPDVEPADAALLSPS